MSSLSNCPVYIYITWNNLKSHWRDNLKTRGQSIMHRYTHWKPLTSSARKKEGYAG